MTESRDAGAPGGRKDPFWNSVASFDLDEVFVLPEWIAELKGEKSVSITAEESGNIPLELDALVSRVGDCRGCILCEERNTIVMGAGNPSAGILFIGEGPGANEDIQGEPFVGRAGKLLDRILAAIDLDRDSVYIANIVKCRPPGNRTPSKDEVAACWWILEEQIRIMRPGVIVSLGAPASRTMTGSNEGIGKLRGAVHRYGDIPVIPTYHPAALLRTDALKRPVWEDMKALRKLLDELGLPRVGKE
ncbi:MAG: uracil-DNA glycosylase [Candidatus Fermentibacteria bacterium]